jgi:hypothetical protein
MNQHSKDAHPRFLWDEAIDRQTSLKHGFKVFTVNRARILRPETVTVVNTATIHLAFFG